MSKAKLKVVHISTSFSGGAARSAFRIHQAMLKNGVDSTFLCAQVNDADLKSVFPLTRRVPTFLERQMRRIKDRVDKRLGLSRKERLYKKLGKISSFLKCEAATLPFSDYDILNNPAVKKADIIHLHWVANVLDFPRFFQKNKKPVVWTFHDMNVFQGLFHYKEDEIRNKEIVGKLDDAVRDIKQKAIKNRKCKLSVVTPSEWLLKEAMKSGSFDNVLTACIAYPLDTVLFAPQQNNDLRQKYDIPEHKIVFLFVAESVSNYRKGFDLLVDALKDLKHLPITLVVLGDAKHLVIEGLDIRKLGKISDDTQLRDLYSLADVFIISSREDNLPNVMLEALACGTPVIGFKIGGIKEHIRNGVNGLLAESVASKSLCVTLDRFCKERHLYNRKTIRAYASDHFNEKLSTEKYLNVYKKMIDLK